MTNLKNRKIIAKFRISNHNLEIETRRYKNIPREFIIYPSSNKIEDENHFSFLTVKKWKKNNHYRVALFETCENIVSDFENIYP